MGYFKSMRELNKIARETQKTTDFQAMRQSNLASMRRSQEMMAAQTKAANMALTGIDATATVAAARQTPTQINFDHVVELDLTVMPDGLPPYPVSLSQAISPVNLARVQPGSTLAVKVDPDDPGSVWIDFMRVP